MRTLAIHPPPTHTHTIAASQCLRASMSLCEYALNDCTSSGDSSGVKSAWTSHFSLLCCLHATFLRVLFPCIQARAVQGIGSACSGCSGLTQVAQMYPEDHLTGPAMAVATMGIGIGVVTGPPFGGLTYVIQSTL